MADFSSDDVLDNPFSEENQEKPTLIFGIPVFPMYMRVLSLMVIAMAVYCWALAIGLSGPHIVDVYLADNHVGIVDGILIVALPALGVGLWLGTSWGYFLWGLCSVGMIVTHFTVERVTVLQYSLGSVLTLALILYVGGGALVWLTKNSSIFGAKS